MAQPDFEAQAPERAGRILDPLIDDSAGPAGFPIPESAERLNLDPDRLVTRHDQPRPVTNPRSPSRRQFVTVQAIVFLVCIGILALLYGLHLALVAFAELKSLQPALGWMYAIALAVMFAILTTSLVRLIVRYRSLKNITGLQAMARRARFQKPVDPDMGRSAILEYLDEIQARCDRQLKRSIEQLRTKFGQYSGDVARDFRLFEEFVLVQIDGQVDARLSDCALQVAVATALASRFFDPLIVSVQAVRIVQETATAYRGRPGFLGTLQLVARAGSAAVFAEVSDVIADTASQLLGIKAAAKLGAHFGVGVTNGFLMIRLGEATKRLCRPVPLPPTDYGHSLKKLVAAFMLQWKIENDAPAASPLSS